MKKLYYLFLGPLYRRIRAEVSEEIRNNKLEILERQERLLKSLNDEKIKKYQAELQKINADHIELVDKTTAHVSAEFVKIYKLIDDMKEGELDVKLNASIVDELIKIHKGLEEIKHSNNGKH